MPRRSAASRVMIGSKPITFIFRPCARSATMRPMLPIPTTPRVLPKTSAPVKLLRSHTPALRLALAAGILRAIAIIIEIACSAVVTLLPWGLFITTMPRRVAASRSTLSTPTPARPITLSESAFSMISRVTVVELRINRASYGAMMVASSAGRNPVLISTCSSGCCLSMSTPCCESESLSRTRNLLEDIPSDTPGDTRLHRGDARAHAHFHAGELERQFERADGDQHVERTYIAHVADAHQLALHLILTALDRHAELIAHVLDDFTGVDAVGREQTGDARRGNFGRDQIQPECDARLASRLRHQRMARIDALQTLGVNQLERFMEAEYQRDGGCPRGRMLIALRL